MAENKEVKQLLDDMHMLKIGLSDQVFIIDMVDGQHYIGKSTQRELAYSRHLKKRIRYYSNEMLPRGPGGG